MASSANRWHLTSRDQAVLTALALCPLRTDQLLALSQTFEEPFPNENKLRRRMQMLSAIGVVQSDLYASTALGRPPSYYQLTSAGWKHLFGVESVPPTKRFLQPVGLSHQHHTQCLADVLIATALAATRHGTRLTNLYPENTYRIAGGPLPDLYPDFRFELVLPDSRLTFCLEIDCATQTVFSNRDRDSIESKMKRYLAYLQTAPWRERVLFLTTGGPERLDHLRRAGWALSPTHGFQPFYFASLSQYVTARDPFFNRIFATPSLVHVPLLRAHARTFFPPRYLRNGSCAPRLPHLRAVRRSLTTALCGVLEKQPLPALT